VIGTTSSADKAKIAHANGCDAVILYTIQDFPLEVMSVTKGRGADLILDAVGKPTIPLDLKCANKRGTIVFYGMAGSAGSDRSVLSLFLSLATVLWWRLL
jgi:NADPH:quinone reductase